MGIILFDHCCSACVVAQLGISAAVDEEQIIERDSPRQATSQQQEHTTLGNMVIPTQQKEDEPEHRRLDFSHCCIWLGPFPLRVFCCAPAALWPLFDEQRCWLNHRSWTQVHAGQQVEIEEWDSVRAFTNMMHCSDANAHKSGTLSDPAQPNKPDASDRLGTPCWAFRMPQLETIPTIRLAVRPSSSLRVYSSRAYLIM